MIDRLVVVAGPTGTGKSDLGLDLAERLHGEVISADSMQLYRGMDIGTAKVPAGQRRGIPHHLLDILDITEKASVAAYQRDACAAIEDILRRGGTPILVGGSGLYIQAVVDGIEFPATDPQVRARLESELDSLGAVPLHGRLAQRDPAAAEIIDIRNGRRIVRALEVIEVTGRPFTATFPKPGPPRYDAVMVCVDRDRELLDDRLAARVHRMMEAGFLAEVRDLIPLGLRDGVTARRALGYRQLLAACDGVMSVDQAVGETVTATRRFVRKQRSWFRRDDRLHWLDGSADDLTERCVTLVRRSAVGWSS